MGSLDLNFDLRSQMEQSFIHFKICTKIKYAESADLAKNKKVKCDWEKSAFESQNKISEVFFEKID